MPVLFALSLMAFVALLWATISIAGYVRRARRRRRAAVKTSDAANPSYAATAVSVTVTTDAPPPPRLRTFPTRLGKHPINPLAPHDPRPEWNPFSQETGDVSDPRPTRRFTRPHNRSRSKDAR